VRVQNDDYPTPAWCTQELLSYLGTQSWWLPLAWSMLEPCAGAGAIVRELAALQPRILAATDPNVQLDSDNIAAAATRTLVFASDKDFRQLEGRWDCIITNPPYSEPLLTEIIDHALSSATHTIMLLRIGWVIGSRKRRAWRQEHPCDLYIPSRRPEFRWTYTCRDCVLVQSVLPGVQMSACPVCGGRLRRSTTDASEYCWAHWWPGATRRWVPL